MGLNCFGISFSSPNITLDSDPTHQKLSKIWLSRYMERVERKCSSRRRGTAWYCRRKNEILPEKKT